MQLCDLFKILEYRNQNVIDRYCLDFDSTPEKAEEYFIDMLKYLWISEKNARESKDNPNLDAFVAMYSEMTPIDNMWHTFILFTKDYFKFCQKYFGHYHHHRPHTKDDKESLKEEFEKQFASFLNYVYDHLGEVTLRRWFSKYL